MRVAFTEPKALEKTERSNAAAGTAHHLRSKSHSEAVIGTTQPTKLARVSGGLIKRPLSTDSLQSLEIATTPKTNETISIPFAQKGMGALASCLLAGSCVQDMVEDPELGMLLVSGHADVLSAKVCALPRGLQQESLDMGARQAPEVSSVQEDVSSSDNGIDNLNTTNQNAANKPNSVVDKSADSSMPSPHLRFARSTSMPTRPIHQATDSSMPSLGPTGKKSRVSMRALFSSVQGSGENRIMAFLRANSSPKADEASCLASSSIDEAPKTRTTPVTRYLRSSRYTKANRLATNNEILGSLEEDGLLPRGRQIVSRRTSQRPSSLS